MKWKWHAGHESGNGLEAAEAFLVLTSTCKPDRRSHGASETVADEDLGTLNVIHKLILPHKREPGEIMNKLEKSMKKMKPGSCLDLTSGIGDHSCDGRSCVRIKSFQREDLTTWFGDITEKEKSEVQIVAECYTNTTVNIATALGFFSRMCSLQSLDML